MKTKLRFIALFTASIISFGIFSGCYGGYVAFKKVHKWNGTLGDKWVKSVVHILLWIVPVYEVCLVVDFFILNTLEFWTGSNPLAMDSDQKELQIVDYNNETYMITATQNRFDIQQMSGAKSGIVTSLIFEPESRAWMVEGSGDSVKVAEMDKNDMNLMQVIAADGTMVGFNLETAATVK